MIATAAAFILILSSLLAGASAGEGASGSGRADIAELFPELDGWRPQGDPAVYAADNLWEYIDGAAELYLTYDFKEMGTLAYADGRGREFTVEIYRHASGADAFGIYSQERPTPMDSAAVGAQGYYSQGVLNFCQGSYYVKLSGYNLAEHDRNVLMAAAGAVSTGIGGDMRLPAALGCFPTRGKVPGSERYIARNLFGHRFLHSAFVARYRAQGEATERAFIIETDDAAESSRVLEDYIRFVEENGRSVSERNGLYRFEDPVSRSVGTLSLKHSGRFVWGISSASESTTDAYISAVEKNLKASGLID